jgi:hypothetical protein
MHCALCRSGNQAEFTAEMLLHFSGIRNIDNPGVLAFPKVSVCLDCGYSRFTTPETDLRILRGTVAQPMLLNSTLAVGGVRQRNLDPTIHS